MRVDQSGNSFQYEKGRVEEYILCKDEINRGIARCSHPLHSGRMAGHTRYRYFVYYPYKYFIACSGVSLARVGKFKVQVV